MIELLNFSKKYSLKDESFAVKNVSFKADKGITCLLGLNGAGKSTIIKAICGEHFPTEGKILISDSSGNFFDSEKESSRCAQLTGYIPEINNLPLNMTVSEYLYFCGKIYGLSGSEFTAAFKRVVHDCSLSEVISKKIHDLSKGYRQRVSFARALIHNPENLILDESINGLDPAQIIQFRKLIKKFAETKTILISTHLMQEVEALCNKIVILNKGQICAEGTENQIITGTGSKNIEEAFIKLCSEQETIS